MDAQPALDALDNALMLPRLSPLPRVRAHRLGRWSRVRMPGPEHARAFLPASKSEIPSLLKPLPDQQLRTLYTMRPDPGWRSPSLSISRASPFTAAAMGGHANTPALFRSARGWIYIRGMHVYPAPPLRRLSLIRAAAPTRVRHALIRSHRRVRSADSICPPISGANSRGIAQRQETVSSLVLIPVAIAESSIRIVRGS